MDPLLRTRPVTAYVDHTLDTPSDHYTLRINLPSGAGARYETQGQYRMDTLSTALFVQTLWFNLPHNQYPSISHNGLS